MRADVRLRYVLRCEYCGCQQVVEVGETVMHQCNTPAVSTNTEEQFRTLNTVNRATVTPDNYDESMTVRTKVDVENDTSPGAGRSQPAHTCTPGLIGSAYGCPACGIGPEALTRDAVSHPGRPQTLSERHQAHYQSCNCLADSAICCLPACPCKQTDPGRCSGGES